MLACHVTRELDPRQFHFGPLFSSRGPRLCHASYPKLPVLIAIHHCLALVAHPTALLSLPCITASQKHQGWGADEVLIKAKSSATSRLRQVSLRSDRLALP